MRSSPMLRRRNSRGSTFAAAAITSMCDSRANTFMLAPGARQGPSAKRWASPAPYTRMRVFGTS